MRISAVIVALVAVSGLFAAGETIKAASLDPPAAYNSFMEISPTPDDAEKKAFLAYLLREWDYRMEFATDAAVCRGLADELNAGNVTFIAPDAFHATEMPQAALEIDKQCPYMHLGRHWSPVQRGPMPRENGERVTEEELTAEFGQPYIVSKDLALYNFDLGNSRGVRPVFASDAYFELIDLKRCRRETQRYSPVVGQIPGAHLRSFARVKGDVFLLEADRSSGPRVEITRIPPDVQLNRREPLFHCRLVGSAPRRK